MYDQQLDSCKQILHPGVEPENSQQTLNFGNQMVYHTEILHRDLT